MHAYGFLKSEYKRLEKTFSPKQFCTVRFSRTLFPQLPRHNLDTIITHFGILVENRHRALDDARATYEFFIKAKEQVDPKIFLQAVEKTLKKPYLPKNLESGILDDLPESPGVYIFYGENDLPLYIGKSIRVLSHFSSDVHSPKEMNISQQITRIETIKTAGELGALFLESRLIKEKLPIYNKMLRLTQELMVLKKKEDQNGYLTTDLEQLSDLTLPKDEDTLGIFRSRKQAKELQSNLALKYSLCEKLLGLEKTSGACFGYRLERCKGACIGKESTLGYNMRFVEAFSQHKIKSWPFKGKILITELDEFEGKTDYFLVDNWCLLSKVQTDTNDSFLEEEYTYTFDLDTYKIIARYLLSPKNIKNIRELLNDN
jgi:DNA polymerase-3 subunit epsilon